MKMPLLAFGFAQLPWNARDVERIARVIVGVVIPVVALSVVANVYYGLDWIRALSGSGGGGYVDYRYGLLSSQGLFDHPLILGNVAGILVMGAFATSAHLGHIRFARAATVVAFVASLASFRRTAIVGVLAAVFVAWPRKARGVLVVGSFILIPVALFVLASEIQETLTATLDEYVYTDAPAARTRLLLGSFQVASEHAPFGAGFARYGSYLAGVDYSPEYIKLGFDGVWGLSNMPGLSGAFLTDTQWPVLIGETGWIGAAAFVGFLIAILRTFLRAGKRDEAHLQWIATFGRGALVVTAFASIGLPVFTSTPIASLFYTIVGIGVALLSAAGAEPVKSLPALADEPSGPRWSRVGVSERSVVQVGPVTSMPGGIAAVIEQYMRMELGGRRSIAYASYWPGRPLRGLLSAGVFPCGLSCAGGAVRPSCTCI
jgi:hypothetical protein